jgi:hypothetical protein
MCRVTSDPSALGGASRVGPGPGSGRGGARSRLSFRGFQRLVGGATAGLPEFGTPGSARTVLTRSGHSVAVSSWCWCVCCLDDPLGADRERVVLCLDAVARLAGSLVAPHGFGCAGHRPFSLLRVVCWPGWSPGRRLHRRQEPLGVIELTLPVALVQCPASSPIRTSGPGWMLERRPPPETIAGIRSTGQGRPRGWPTPVDSRQGDGLEDLQPGRSRGRGCPVAGRALKGLIAKNGSDQS